MKKNYGLGARTNPDVNLKTMHQLFCHMTLPYKVFFIFINLLKSDVDKIISTTMMLLFKFLKLL